MTVYSRLWGDKEVETETTKVAVDVIVPIWVIAVSDRDGQGKAHDPGGADQRRACIAVAAEPGCRHHRVGVRWYGAVPRLRCKRYHWSLDGRLRLPWRGGRLEGIGLRQRGAIRLERR